MATVSTLKKRAQYVTKFRGHAMKWQSPIIVSGWTVHGGRNGARVTQNAYCKHCGMGVYLDNYPPANGIDISGDAIALTCKKGSL